MKEKGQVGQGDRDADCTLTLDDKVFADLANGANAQTLFMTGKIKIQGNIMAATKLGNVLEKAAGSSSAKL